MQNLDVIIPIKASDWRIAKKNLPLIKKNLDPKKIIIISSASLEKELKKEDGVEFIDENIMYPGMTFNSVRNLMLKHSNHKEFSGWFLQQFIKYAYAFMTNDEYYLVWDADTLPLNPIKMFDEKSGKPFFNMKTEFVPAYFVTIRNLFGYDKVCDESFITEHMVFSTKIIKEIIAKIEADTVIKGKYFYEKILNASAYQMWPQAFSEYETYGTYTEINYPDVYIKRFLRTQRNARIFLGDDPSSETLEWAGKCFDTISFEQNQSPIGRCVQLSKSNLFRILFSFKALIEMTYVYKKALKRDVIHMEDLLSMDYFWRHGRPLYLDSNEYKKKIISDAKPNNKKCLLYNASILGNTFDADQNRSGLFFVAYYLFTKLADSDAFRMYAYCEPNTYENVKRAIKEFRYENIEVICRGKDAEKLYEKVDIYLSPTDPAPIEIARLSQITKYLILYDAGERALGGSETHRSGYFDAVTNSLSPYDYYFAISASTKSEFLKYYPKQLDPDKITVAYLAASDRFHYCEDEQAKNELKKKYNIQGKYILSVSTLGPRKNLIAAVRCFVRFVSESNIDDLFFVLAGGNMENTLQELTDEIASLGQYGDKIIMTGYVDDDELPILYSGALFTIYVSLYEGFGLPILEAMQCGCPVITSNVTSMPEVIGDCGIVVDPRDDDEIVSAYGKYYFNDALRAECRSKGLERARTFSWDRFAETIIDELKKQKPIFVDPNPYAVQTVVSEGGAMKPGKRLIKKMKSVFPVSSRSFYANASIVLSQLNKMETYTASNIRKLEEEIEKQQRQIEVLANKNITVTDLIKKIQESNDLMNEKVNNYELYDYYRKIHILTEIKDVITDGHGGKVRIGQNRDGGYVLFSPIAEGSVVYSFGLGNNVDWDLAMAEMGFDIYMYDHTIYALPTEHERFHFFKSGISGVPGKPNLKTIDECLKANNHIGRKDIVLKMDVEGAEWEFLNNISLETLQQFSQIVFEMHGLSDLSKASEIIPALEKLSKTHQAIHIHANNYCGKFKVCGILMPDAIELTLVRKSDHTFTQSITTFPTKLDYPNHAEFPDIDLGNWSLYR